MVARTVSTTGAADGIDVMSGLVVTADAVEVVAVKADAFDVGVASMDVGEVIVEPDAITLVAVVVVDVMTVTCAAIIDDPTEASLPASRAAAGDIGSLLVVVVVVVELVDAVVIIRASPRCIDSGPVSFEPPDGVGVFTFAFICICSNAALSDCSCFFPFPVDFLDLLVLDAAVVVEPTRTIIGS